MVYSSGDRLQTPHHSPDGIIDKMSALVTHQNPWTSKSGDHFLKQEVCCCLCTTVFDWCCFFPSC
jgi:hypothetical protein